MSGLPQLECRGRGRWLATVRPGDARRACGIRQATIAAALGVSHVAVHYWETGRKGPSGEARAAYCRVVAGLLRHLEVPEDLDGAA